MKKTLLFIVALLCYSFSFSQTFNYQAVVRDAAGDPVTNQSMGVLVRIIAGSPTGSVLYNEAHTVTSNDQGVITLPVGDGASGANFLAIDWSTQNHWIDIQVDLSGGTNYTQIGTSELRFVPYAMYALNSNQAGNAGVFAKNGTVVSNGNGDNLNDDFVFGSSQLDHFSLNSPLNARMFYDKSKRAFRAGFTFDDDWNEENIGDYSVGFGEGGLASGRNSFSMGRNANATGREGVAFGTNAGAFADYSRGMGLNARAFGINATAIGRQLTANSMAEIQLGQYSTFVSGSANTWVPTDRLFVIGNGEEDINQALNSDALVMLKNGNTTLNGTFTIDGDNQGPGTAFTLPAQDGTANQVMQTDGAGNVTWVSPAASAIPNGGTNGYVLSTNGSGVLSWVTNDDTDADPTNEIELPAQASESGKFLTTNGTTPSWQDIPNELPTGGTDGQVLSTDGAGAYTWVDQPAESAFATINNITSNGANAYGADDFIFGAPTNETGSDIFAANRIFFDKNKAAIRIGRDIGGQNAFADVNVGAYSAAFGINPKAAGENAFAAGFIPNASGHSAIAIGNTANATNTSTIALGNNVTASGGFAIAIGRQLTSEALNQTTIGYYNTPVAGNPNTIVDTDRLFVIGNGTTDINGINHSDALVVLKNGNTTINGTLTIDGDNQEAGTSYTLPAQDGTANQIMSTDGSGNVSWIDAASGGSGAFSTTANVTSNSNGAIATDDFVFGSTQVENDTGTTDDDNRFFFDKSSGIFRAGRALSDEWNYTNMGAHSVAFGSNNIARGPGSSAFGTSNSAEAFNSFVSGENNSISNLAINSTAFGVGNTNTGLTTFAAGLTNTLPATSGIALGSNLYADSYNQITIGYNNSQVSGNLITPVLTDRLFVIGNGATPSSRSDALVVLKNGNTTLNGQLTIDGDNQGAGASYTLPAQDGTVNQILTTDGSGNVAWTNAASGGAFTTTAGVTSNANGAIATDDFVFGSTQLDDDGTDNSGDETRMFFDKSKGAFRAGTSTEIDGFGGAWNSGAVGNYSTALGRGSIATNTASTALGSYNQVNGEDAFAAGRQNLASRPSSIALGANNSVSGQYAVGLGRGSQATSYGHQTLGLFSEGISGTYNNYVTTDALFVIGNGTSDVSRSNALVMRKNGNTTLNGQLTIDGDNTGTGASYTLPAQDGTANQILTTDGSGTTTWTDAPTIASTFTTLDEGNGNGVALTNRVDANYGNIGNNAFDVSFSNVASTTKGATGAFSTATGINTTASGFASLASGEDAIASGSISTAIGFASKAEGNSSIALGENTQARAYAETVIGLNNTAPAPASATAYNANDRLFVIGNGASEVAKSDAMVVQKNGNTTINGNTTVNGDLITDSIKVNSLPAFNVTSNGSSYTSAGPKEVGNWNATVNTDLFNDGSHLNITNGRFTAPVEGLYYFSAQVRIDAINPNTPVDGAVYSRLMIVKNGDRKGFRNGLHSIRNADNGTAFYDTQHVSGVLKLNAGDYVSVFVESTGDTNFTVQAESGFNGYLVNRL